METIIMEQHKDGKMAIDEKSMENVLQLVSHTALSLLIPDGVDLKNDVRALFAKATIEAVGALTLVAMFHPTLFTQIAEELDVAEIDVQNVADDNEAQDIINKLKKGAMYS